MLLVLLIGVFILYQLQDILFTRLWNKDVSVKLSFSDKYIYEGDKSSLKEVVINNKRLPLPALSVRLAINRDLEFLNDAKYNSTTSDLTYKRDVFSFISKQQITRSLPFVGKKRGYYQFDNIDIVANNFFFKESSYISLPQDTSLFVYPSQISTQGISLICKEITGTILNQSRLYPDPFEFYGIREYHRSDPIKFINWKSSARTGELMVNQFDSTTNINLTLLFDIEDNNILKQELLVEETIRIVSSLSAKLISAGMPINVKGNAIDYISGEMLGEYLPAGGGKIMELNQKLACIEVENTTTPGSTIINNEAENLVSGSSYVFISKNLTQSNLEAISSLAGSSSGILWVVPCMPYDPDIENSIAGVNFLRWEVKA